MSDASVFINKVVSISYAISKMGVHGLRLPKEILPIFDSIELLVLRFYRDSHKLDKVDTKFIEDHMKMLTNDMTSLYTNAFETAILMSLPKEKK